MSDRPKIPSNEDIVGEAIRILEKKVPSPMSPDSIRENFSDSVETLFNTAYETYKKYAGEEKEAIISDKVGGLEKETYTRDEVSVLIREMMEDAARLEMSQKQSRSSRAGKSFEIIIKELLDRLGISSEGITREHKKSGLRRIDLVIPDKATAIESPDTAHFLSLKTSLRERWMQVAEEQTQGQRTHLLTILQNETLSAETARKITERGIFLYVPDRVKDDLFPDNPRIRGLSSIPGVVGSRSA